MRANGVPERFCTGDASPREKFQAWAKTVPHTLRNPLYHWTHLELKRYFGIDELLDEKTADSVWDRANEALQSPQLSAKGHPAQVLREGGLHDRRSRGSADVSRADCGIRPADEDLSDIPRRSRDGSASAGRLQCVDRQARQTADVHIAQLGDLLEALRRRHQAFHDIGGRLSDHGLDHAMRPTAPMAQAKAIFAKARGGQPATAERARGVRVVHDGVLRAS